MSTRFAAALRAVALLAAVLAGSFSADRTVPAAVLRYCR